MYAWMYKYIHTYVFMFSDVVGVFLDFILIVANIKIRWYHSFVCVKDKPNKVDFALKSNRMSFCRLYNNIFFQLIRELRAKNVSKYFFYLRPFSPSSDIIKLGNCQFN